MPELEPRFNPGDRIAENYTVDAFLAHGSVSEVYRAIPDGGCEPVALKIMNEESTHGADKGSADRRLAFFLREAAVTAQLVHPNIVSLLEVGYHAAAGYFLALEFLDGRPLDQLLEEDGVLDEERARDVATQILSALSVAHRQDVLHRDLKPGNIQIKTDSEGQDHVKLFDFGVAKLWQSVPSAREPTRTGTLVGTPMWMSPEQCRGMKLTVRSDIYSVGALLYYLVTGQTPFENNSIFQVLNDVLATEPRSVNAVRVEAGLRPVSRTLEKAIRRALAKQPDERFVDADHMTSYLDRDAPSTEWDAIPTSMVMMWPSRGFPGVIAIQRHFVDPENRTLESLVHAALAALGEEEGGALELQNLSTDAVSVVLEVGDTPAMTILETAGLSFRLHRVLQQSSGGPVSMLISTGDANLGLSPREGEPPPLFAHLHQYLYEQLEYERNSRDISLSRGRVMATPEWLSELRVEFDCCRLTADPHGPIHVLGLSEDQGGDEEPSPQSLVREALSIQHSGIGMRDLEEVLFMSVDPIEALSAISDLQASGEVFQDHRGRVTLARMSEALPPAALRPTERRLLCLRFFASLVHRERSVENFLRLAESAEAAHSLSAVPLWMQAAGFQEPAEAVTSLLRAFRLAANRKQHELLPTISKALARLYQEMDSTTVSIDWARLHTRLRDNHTRVDGPAT